jgi:hypothetical protein
MARDVWQKTITNLQGDVLEGAQITVRDQETDALATIFANQSGGSALANPFLTDAQGVARFFAEPGFYKVTAFKDGFGTAEFIWNNVGDNRLREDISADGLNAATNLILRTGGTERARIDSAGNVGIGTTSPSNSLSIVRSGSIDAEVGTITNTGRTGFAMQNDGGFAGLFKDNAAASGFAKGAYSVNLYNSAAVPTVFWTNDTERMRIDSAGNVGIGTSNPSTRRLFVAGGESGSHMAEFQNTLTSGSLFGPLFQFNSSPNDTTSVFLNCADSTAVRMTVFSNGNIVNQNNSYGAISDVKLKENIEPATPKLDKLMQVEIVNYNMIGDEQKQIGVTAQQLEQVFPSLIQESSDFEKVQVPQLNEDGKPVLDEDGNPVLVEENQPTGTKTKSVKYSVFVPILIKAMQEQQAIIDDLKERIEALEG